MTGGRARRPRRAAAGRRPARRRPRPRPAVRRRGVPAADAGRRRPPRRRRSATSPPHAGAGDAAARPRRADLGRGARRRCSRRRAAERRAAPRCAGRGAPASWDAEAERRFLGDGRAAAAPAAPSDAPLVTVVMPVRNRPDAVRAAVASVVAQTLRRLGARRRGRRLRRRDARASSPSSPPPTRGCAWLHRCRRPGVCAARNAGHRGRPGALGGVPRLGQHLGAALPARDARRGWSARGRRAGARRRRLRAAAARPLPGVRGRARRAARAQPRRPQHARRRAARCSTRSAASTWRCAAGSTTTSRSASPAGRRSRSCRSSASATTTPAGDEGAGSRITRHRVRPLAVRRPRQGARRLGRAPARGRRAVPGRVTVSMPTYEDWSMTVTRRPRGARARPDGRGGRRRGARRRQRLAAGGGGDPRPPRSSASRGCGCCTQARNLNFATGSNLGCAAGHRRRRRVPQQRHPGAARLAGAAASPRWPDDATLGAQPLLLYPDGTVQSAGHGVPRATAACRCRAARRPRGRRRRAASRRSGCRS